MKIVKEILDTTTDKRFGESTIVKVKYIENGKPGICKLVLANKKRIYIGMRF